MLKNAHFRGSGGHAVDQRNHVRVQVKSVIYIELDGENGGLITNISEGGVAVQCAEPIAGELFSQMRFRFPRSENWIEIKGTLVWLGNSRKEAGIQFLDLNSDARRQIQDWVNLAAFGPGITVEQGGFPAAFESEGAHPAVETVAANESAEIDAMFPSEKSLASPISTSASRRPPSKETDSPVNFGIPPAAIKRSLPTGRFTSELESPPLTHATVRNRDSWQEHSYPSANPAIAGEPPLSVLSDAPKDQNLRTESEPPVKESPVPAFPVRTDYRRLAYDPQPFEEPSGKGWLFTGGVLIALLLVGGIMALGPSNVRALAARYVASASRYISSGPPRSDAAISTSGPPPPASASDKSASRASGGDSGSSSDAANNNVLNDHLLPADQAPQQPTLNAENAPSATNTHQTHEAVKRGDESAAQTTIASGGATALLRPVQQARTEAKRPEPEYQPSDDPEAVTRLFQMEHSSSNGASAAPSVHSAFPQTAPPMAGLSTRNENARTLDAYPEPEPRASGSMQAARSYANPTPAPELPAARSGTVAISSRFRSLRGEEPQETLSNPTLVIGQLLSIRQPVYPVEASRAGVEGTVRVRATVDQTGRVVVVQALSGPPMLIASAVEAVREWRYGQTFVEGHAVEGLEDVSIDFRLANAAASPR